MRGNRGFGGGIQARKEGWPLNGLRGELDLSNGRDDPSEGMADGSTVVGVRDHTRILSLTRFKFLEQLTCPLESVAEAEPL